MLDLLAYLQTHFYTRAQLLTASGVSDAQLAQWQQAGAMSAASYVLDLSGGCDSFFGLHALQERCEFYARGYAAWLGSLQSLPAPEDAAALFARRYRQRIAALFGVGYETADPRYTTGLDAHIAQEWAAFGKGVYGLCTRSGLPEDIAAKELATAIIDEMTRHATPADLDAQARARLGRAVALLDQACAPFAPHERTRSSRHRLVDGVRKTYALD